VFGLYKVVVTLTSPDLPLFHVARGWNVFWDISTAGTQKQDIPDAMISVEVGWIRVTPSQDIALVAMTGRRYACNALQAFIATQTKRQAWTVSRSPDCPPSSCSAQGEILSRIFSVGNAAKQETPDTADVLGNLETLAPQAVGKTTPSPDVSLKRPLQNPDSTTPSYRPSNRPSNRTNGSDSQGHALFDPTFLGAVVDCDRGRLRKRLACGQPVRPVRHQHMDTWNMLWIFMLGGQF
jgi:hypothetical protein